MGVDQMYMVFSDKFCQAADETDIEGFLGLKYMGYESAPKHFII